MLRLYFTQLTLHFHVCQCTSKPRHSRLLTVLAHPAVTVARLPASIMPASVPEVCWVGQRARGQVVDGAIQMMLSADFRLASSIDCHHRFRCQPPAFTPLHLPTTSTGTLWHTLARGVCRTEMRAAASGADCAGYQPDPRRSPKLAHLAHLAHPSATTVSPAPRHTRAHGGTPGTGGVCRPRRTQIV